jgi:hypothetical protein
MYVDVRVGAVGHATVHVSSNVWPMGFEVLSWVVVALRKPSASKRGIRG